MLLTLTAFADWAFGRNISLAALYIVPVMVGAVVLHPVETATLAVVCSYSRHCFETPGSSVEESLRFVFAALAYLASGLFVTELVRNHELVTEHLDRIRVEQNLRRDLEEQLRVLVDSSPAAILTVDREGGVTTSDRERARTIAKMRVEIDAGFASVASSVARVRATPCRMLEAWALGDREAIRRVRSRRIDDADVPARPEVLWGDQRDPTSNHPKCVLTRVLGQEPNARSFEDLARESDPSTLRASCPESFKPFEEELRKAFPSDEDSAPRRRRRSEP